jgi:hypothetical protein
MNVTQGDFKMKSIMNTTVKEVSGELSPTTIASFKFTVQTRGGNRRKNMIEPEGWQ